MRRSAPRAKPAVLALLAVVVAVALGASAAGGADTAAKAPTASANDTSVGTVAWNSGSMASAYASDDARAYVGLTGQTSNYLVLTGFGFAVPSDATVTGIRVALERSRSGTEDIRDHSIKLVKGGTITGSDRADTTTTWPTSDATRTYGSTTDMWGTTLTPSDVNASGFGVAIAARNHTSSGNFARVDSVTITVTYESSSAPVNTVPPSISGAAAVGATLTRVAGTWSGTTPMTFAYQWLRCDSGGANCASISGATATTYTLGSADAGSTIRVRETATNSVGSASATSAATAVVSAPSTAGPRSPAVGGNDASTGTAAWSATGDADASDNARAYVSLATGTTTQYLKLTSFGFALPSDATIVGVEVSIERSQSGSTGDVRDASVRLVKAGAPAGSSRAKTSVTWPAGDGGEAATAYGSASDLWGTTLTAADVNASGFGVAISATNSGSSNFARIDHATVTITYSTGGGGGTAPTNTTPPSISGSATVGATLTRVQGTWSGTTPITYSYQWRRCDSGGANCANISGATGTSYTLTSSDLDKTVRVVETATNSVGSASATSPQTAVVTNSGPTSWTATNYDYRVLANPSAPYTSWTGFWKNPTDGSLWIGFTQADGTQGSGTPTWVDDRIGGPYPAEKDFWDLQTSLQYLRSTDGGASWPSYNAVAAGTDWMRTWNPAVSDCSGSNPSGSNCPTIHPIPFTPQANIMLDDGTLIRRVNGEDVKYDLNVQATAYLQRLTPGGTWGAPEYPLPGLATGSQSGCGCTIQISRIRKLADGKLMALGQKWNRYNPKGTERRLLILVGEANATQWREALTFESPDFANDPFVADEWDAIELSNGNLFAVFRTRTPDANNSSWWERTQAVLTKTLTGWHLSNAAVKVTPFEHSGHPELISTSAGAILYLATNDEAGQKGIWYITPANAQANDPSKWTKLPFATNDGDTGNCVTAGSAYNCSTRYYPKAIEHCASGVCTIHVASHVGADDSWWEVAPSAGKCEPPPDDGPLPLCKDQRIVLQSFRLTSP